MTAAFMTEAFELEPIGAPPQFAKLVKIYPEFLDMPGGNRSKSKAVTVNTERIINSLIRSVNREKYVRDIDRTGLADLWQPDHGGDCEDKALYFMQRLTEIRPIFFGSLRLAICELKRGPIHAVAIIESRHRDYVADPTLATYMVDWRRYPVKRWIMRQSHGHLWQTFNPKPEGEKN